MGRPFYFLSDLNFKCSCMQVFFHLLPDFLPQRTQKLLELLHLEKQKLLALRMNTENKVFSLWKLKRFNQVKYIDWFLIFKIPFLDSQETFLYFPKLS